jgi:NADH:ubiquinone oxidoreductase subunit 6 (subunit J)
MADVNVLYLLIAAMAVPAILIFLRRKPLDSVICLAVAAAGSSLLFIYLGQTLVALLQLFVFVGGLSAYLVISTSLQEKSVNAPLLGRALYWVKFFVAAVVVAAVLSLVLLGIGTGQQQAPAGNSFSSAAETAFGGQYALLYVSAFLLFAAAAGSVLTLRRFLKMVV